MLLTYDKYFLTKSVESELLAYNVYFYAINSQPLYSLWEGFIKSYRKNTLTEDVFKRSVWKALDDLQQEKGTPNSVIDEKTAAALFTSQQNYRIRSAKKRPWSPSLFSEGSADDENPAKRQELSSPSPEY